MRQSQILPLLVYLVLVLTYLWFTTKFKKGWTNKSIIVKGGKLNVLLVIFISFIVLALIVKNTMWLNIFSQFLTQLILQTPISWKFYILIITGGEFFPKEVFIQLFFNAFQLFFSNGLNKPLSKRDLSKQSFIEAFFLSA